MAGLHFPITADNSNFMNALHEVTASVREASRQIEADGGSIDRTIERIKTGLVTLGAGLGFKEIAGAVATTRGEFQQLEVAFKTMLGSGEEAAALMNQLVRTAAITPFDLQGVANGAKQLLAYGVSADDVNHRLVQLGDIAAGLSIPLNDLVYLYGTTLTQGKMFTQDLRQFQGRGIPIADELAKQFGVAKDKVGELVTAGKVGSKEFIAAIDAMTGPGSKFGGLMEEQSKTISGQISNIEDAVDSMLNEIGKSSEGLINTTLSVTSSLVENWQTVLAILGDIAAAYGVQKAMLALDAGFTKAATNYGYDAEIEQLKALIPLKEEEQLTALQQAVASGNLTEAKAAEIAALREEAQAQLTALTAKETAAQTEAASAAAKVEAINEEILGIRNLKESLLEQYTAATNAGDAEKAQAIATDIASAETWLKEEAATAATLAEEARTAATNAAAASEARETLATQINTAETAGNTAATGVLTMAKGKLAIAIGKVNAMLKANQFAIAAGAVIALGYAVYKLITYQSDYEKSLDRLNDAHTKSQQGIYKENVEIERMFGKLKNAKKGTEEWEAARNQIWSKYGQYLKSLGNEKTALNDVAAAYDLVKKKAVEAAKARAMDSFLQSESESYATDMADNFDKAYKLISKKFGESFAAANEDAIRNVIEGTSNVSKELLEKFDKYTTYTSSTGYNQTVRSNELSAILAQSANRRKDFDKLYAETERKFGMKRPETTTQETQSETTLQEAYNKAKNDYETAKTEVAKMEANRKAYTQTAYENAKTNLKAYKEAYEKLGGVTKEKSGPTAAQTESKQTEAHQKLIALMKQQAEERLKLQQDYEYQQWQNRIDLMEEGEAKVLEQMRLDQEKERTALEEQKQQAIQAEIARQKAVFDARQEEIAAGNKKYAKKIFDPDTDVDQSQIKVITDRYDALNADLFAKQKKADADRLKAAADSFNAYLKEFGDYQQKREAIAADYDKRIAEASNSGERMMLDAQKNKALSDLDYQQWIDSEEIALAFGDISNLSKQTVTRLIEDMERYREKVVATFDPEKIEKYEEALNKLRMADIGDAFSAFGNMVPEYFTKRLAIQKQINDEAQIGIELARKRNELDMQTAATEGTVRIQAKAAGVNISDEDLADPAKIQQIADRISASAASGNKFASSLHSALIELLKLKGESAELEKATKKWDGNFSHLKETLEGLDGEEKFRAIAESVGSAAGLVGDLASQASELADAMGAGGLGKALGTVGEAMGSVQNVASGFAKGGLVGGIAAAAGEAMKWATKLFMAGDAKHQKNIERLQEQIDALGKSYEKLGKAADKAYSTDASKMISQQNTMLKQQQVLIRQQMAEEEAKKKTDKDKIKEYKERLEEINELLEENAEKAKEAIIGKDVKSAIDEFASLYAGAWDDGTDAAQKSMAAVKSIISSALTELLKKNIQPAAQNFYDTLAKAMEDGILTDAELANLDTIKAQMDALAASREEQYRKIQERYKDLDELREELTDISFDSVRDNFKSLLSDMESTTEDFTENWTDMVRNALIDGLMDTKYDAMLKEWYDEFAEAMNDRALTDSERDALRQQYDAIVQQGIADRNAINSIVGGGAYSQQASSGSSWNMNQETGDELNGRFTAMVELEATNNVLVSDGNAIAREILATLRSMTGLSMTVTGNGDNETLLAIKDMMFLSTGYLESIDKNSRHLAAISSEISEIKTAVKNI